MFAHPKDCTFTARTTRHAMWCTERSYSRTIVQCFNLGVSIVTRTIFKKLKKKSLLTKMPVPGSDLKRKK